MGKRKNRGAGTVFKRKDGYWIGKLSLGRSMPGQLRAKSVCATSRTQCRARLEELRAQYLPKKRFHANWETPFGEWLYHWFDCYLKDRVSAGSASRYEQIIRLHIVPMLGETPLGELKNMDFRNFCDKRRVIPTNPDYCPASCIRIGHSLCCRALEQAVKEGHISTNPAKGCALPAEEARERLLLSEYDLRKILIQAKADGYYELFLLEVATGLREGELAALQWSDFDWASRKLHITKQIQRIGGAHVLVRPKTSKSTRSVVLPPVVIQALKDYEGRATSKWLFPSPERENMPVTGATIRNRLKAVLKRADCAGMRFHDLRHYFATAAIQYGVDLKTLSYVMGHTSSETTLDVYAHVNDRMRRQAAACIDRRVAKADGRESGRNRAKRRTWPEFEPTETVRRAHGEGSIRQKSDHCYEGSYSPIWTNGRTKVFRVYAPTREECESKLDALIDRVNRERKLAAEREAIAADKTLGTRARKQRLVKAYLDYKPEMSDAEIAEVVCCSERTVAWWRKDT